VRWWIPRWRAIRRKFIPSTYNCMACLRTSSGYPCSFGLGVYFHPQCMQRYRCEPDPFFPALFCRVVW
jgi:hypothetical protein